MGAPHEGRGWRYWLDELFLHPHWGLIGSLAVFAAVLFVVFEVSAWIDCHDHGAAGRCAGRLAAGVRPAASSAARWSTA